MFKSVVAGLLLLVSCAVCAQKLTSPPPSAAASANPKWIMCNQTYALCSAAKCTPSPENPNQSSLCACDVYTGNNLGRTSCEDRQPVSINSTTTLVRSTFSFANHNTAPKMMHCKEGNPWSDCMDAECTIDPTDSTTALCVCKLHHTKAFMTSGGGCNPSTCSDHYWSGASETDVNQNYRTVLNFNESNKNIDDFRCEVASKPSTKPSGTKPTSSPVTPSTTKSTTTPTTPPATQKSSTATQKSSVATTTTPKASTTPNASTPAVTPATTQKSPTSNVSQKNSTPKVVSHSVTTPTARTLKSEPEATSLSPRQSVTTDVLSRIDPKSAAGKIVLQAAATLNAPTTVVSNTEATKVKQPEVVIEEAIAAASTEQPTAKIAANDTKAALPFSDALQSLAALSQGNTTTFGDAYGAH